MRDWCFVSSLASDNDSFITVLQAADIFKHIVSLEQHQYPYKPLYAHLDIPRCLGDGYILFTEVVIHFFFLACEHRNLQSGR